MKWSTPKWLLKKYWNSILDRIAPTKATEVDGLKFRYLRGEPPPHDPQETALRRVEFHDRIGSLSGLVAIDVGAHIGSYTLRLARRFEKVIAFEPNPSHARILRLNLALNGIRNVSVKQVALSDSSITGTLYIRGGGATSLDPSHYGLKYDKAILVPTARLDDFTSHISDLDLVKIDAEGQEVRILDGARETISRFKPTLAMEIHRARVPSDGGCCCEACKTLGKLGYVVTVTGEFCLVGDVHWIWATPT